MKRKRQECLFLSFMASVRTWLRAIDGASLKRPVIELKPLVGLLEIAILHRNNSVPHLF